MPLCGSRPGGGAVPHSTRIDQVPLVQKNCVPVGEAGKAVPHYALSTLLRNTQR